MTIAEFKRHAGSPVHQSTEDPSMQILGFDVIPDWVRLPAQLGGGRRAVLGNKVVTCPCGGPHKVRELDLGDRMFVAECPVKNFMWYRRPEESSDAG